MADDSFVDDSKAIHRAWLVRTFENDGATAILIAFVIFLSSVPLFGIGFYSTQLFAPSVDAQRISDVASAATGMSATFTCEAGKWIRTVYNNARISIDLSDGRELGVPAVYAATGMKFANTDNSFVFSDKNDTAEITENGTPTYNDCIIQR